MPNIELITNFVEMHQILVYFILFVGVMLEGEFTLIVAGILAHLGVVYILPTVLFCLLGSMSKSVFSYMIGMFLNNKFNHNIFFKYLEKKIKAFLPHFKEKPFWSIFISKFIFGVNNLTLLFAGYLKIKLKTYIRAEVFATAVWLPVMLSLGYFFSYTAFSISKEIRKFTLIILLFVIGFLLFEKLLAFLYELYEEYHDREK